MIAPRPGVAVLVALALGAQAHALELPEAPDGHVFDAADSLGDRRRNDLEAELARIRKAHRIDIHAVVWDRDLPAEGDLAVLAAELGSAWAREDRWVVVLQAPGAAGTIVGAHGGFATGPETASGDAALAAGLARGRREWTAPARLAGSALESAEEFVFFKYASARSASPVANSLPTAGAIAPSESRLVRIAAICALVLLLALLAFAWSLQNRSKAEPKAQRFPETRWKRRFGAPWSGGSELGATFPTAKS